MGNVIEGISDLLFFLFSVGQSAGSEPLFGFSRFEAVVLNAFRSIIQMLIGILLV